MSDENNISQEDIDSLLAEAELDDAQAAAEPVDQQNQSAGQKAEADGLSELSSDDIDALLSQVEEEDSDSTETKDDGTGEGEKEVPELEAPHRETMPVAELDESDDEQVYIPPPTANFTGQTPAGNFASRDIDFIMDIPLQLRVEVGRTRVTIASLLSYGPGAVIELEKLAGEPLEIFVNNKLIARGEAVVINDKFGVRLTDVVSKTERIENLS